MRREREYRCLPLWRAHETMLKLSGRSESGNSVQGAGWRAHMRDGEPIAIGTLHVGRIFIEFEGEEPAVAEVIAALHKKALRAGG
jgi:hypothetical protein